MADWLEAFVPLRVHVLIRFGRWDDLIAEPLPEDLELYCATAATHPLRPWRRATPPTAAAGAGPRRAGGCSRPRTRASRRPDTCSTTPPATSSPIAAAMLDGEIAYREGRFDDAFAQSAQRPSSSTTALPYDEPWGWMQPTRHAYGALLLEQGHVEEAAAVYARRPRPGFDTLSRPCQHPGQRMEPARISRMPEPVGPQCRSDDHRTSARAGPRTCRRADPRLVRVQAGRGRRWLLRLKPFRQPNATPSRCSADSHPFRLPQRVEVIASACSLS